MEVYVVRHTQVAVPEGICYGQLDVPVADTFKQEASDLKAKLPQGFDLVLSSPLTRCKVLTATLTDAEVEWKTALKELDFGDWEGQKWDDISETELMPWMTDFVTVAPPNGESYQSMYDRVAQIIDELRVVRKEYNRVLIVAHSGVIRAIWAYLLGFDLKSSFKLPVGFGELFVFKLGAMPDYDKIIRKT